MRDSGSTRPIVFFFLILPYGIATGFVTVTLPFICTRAGLSVATTGSIVAVAVLPLVTQFLFAPVIDVTLTLRRWYVLGVGGCAATLVLLAAAPVRPATVPLLMAAAFVSQLAGTVLLLPVIGLIAQTVAEDEKGRASGWYQAGNLGGTGLGGGAGVWLAGHVSTPVAGAALAAGGLAAAAALRWVAPPVGAARATAGVGDQLRGIGSALLEMVRSPVTCLVALLVLSPIGAGAASNLWSAVAPDWHARVGTVALVTGVLYAAATCLGSVGGGWAADRVGRWWAYFGSGALMAAVATAMAAAPRTEAVYASGVFGYALTQGLAYAAFTALVVHVIGRGMVATKYGILGSLGNIPVSYMTAFDGWAHDRWGAGGMLQAEAVLGVAAIAVALAALAWVRSRAAERATVVPAAG